MEFNQSSNECLATAYHEKVLEMKNLIATLKKEIQTFNHAKDSRPTHPLEIPQQLQRALEYTDDPKLQTVLKKMKNTMKVG